MTPDREQIIKDFEHAVNKARGEYYDYVDLTVEDADEILKLLKEQEAQVMTLEEVKAFDWEYCYLEEERLPGKEYRMVCGDYALTCITWPCVASMRIQHGDNSYGKKWRCWTSKPTNEQRTAVKWNDENGHIDEHQTEVV